MVDITGRLGRIFGMVENRGVSGSIVDPAITSEPGTLFHFIISTNRENLTLWFSFSVSGDTLSWTGNNPWYEFNDLTLVYGKY